jgi:hypothetical protein
LYHIIVSPVNDCIHSGHGCSDQTQHYYPGTTTTGVDKVLDGRKREDYLNNIQSSFEIDDNESEEAVRYKTLKLDQVKLNISSIGMKKRAD